MFGGSKQEQLEHRLDHKLNASSDGIDMDVPAKVISSETVYTGRIFHVDDMRIALTDKQGKEHEIGRQVLRHAPCVVMLVHDMSTDRYLIEREYRAGSDMFAYGLPAGLMDEGEDIMDAALRELAEETGVVPDRNAMGVDFVGDFYSSEGMTDELAHIMCCIWARSGGSSAISTRTSTWNPRGFRGATLPPRASPHPIR